LKINTKLGGVNHTLASRLPTDLGKRGRENGTDEHHNDSKSEEPKVFQEPPNSISWLFNEPCMLLGIDINHPGTINIFIINPTLTPYYKNRAHHNHLLHLSSVQWMGR